MIHINNNVNNIDMTGQAQNDNLDTDFIIYFKYKQKEIYLDTEPDIPLINVLNNLKQKYDWINQIQIKELRFNGKPLNPKLSCNQLGIKDESKIEIIG